MPEDVSSPFIPGIPVPVEFFIGRINEIEHLRGKVVSAERGRLEVGFLAGERGAGAYQFTNLLHYLYFCIEAERAKETHKL